MNMIIINESEFEFTMRNIILKFKIFNIASEISQSYIIYKF